MFPRLFVVLVLVACSDGDTLPDTAPDPGTTPTGGGTVSGPSTTGAPTTTSTTGATTSSTTGSTTGSTPTTGAAWRFDPAATLVTTPAAIGPLLGGILDSPPLATEVLGGATTTTTGAALTPFTLRVGRAESSAVPPTQDACVETTDLPGTIDASGRFEVSIASMPAREAGVVVTLEDVVIRGTISPAGNLENVDWEAWVDTRNMGTLVAGTPDPGVVCDLVAAFGVSCAPCPSGASPYCIEYAAEGRADLDPALVVQAYTTAAVQANPLCP